MDRTWFDTGECTRLEIRWYRSISDHGVRGSLVVADARYIRGVMERIERIPPEGDEMISFGPNAEHVELKFTCAGRLRSIDFYEGRLKTPSTGFHSTGGQIETGLYEDIQALLSPRLGLPIPVVEGLRIGFQGFTVTFAGCQVLDKENATVSLTRRFFRIADARGDERTVEIVHGQLPPPPTILEVNGKRLTLLTMETRDGRRLFPDYFQVVRA
ncbi:MAG: hypothetical protein JW820_06070 [Spirochaetales bacterium]|nr:hypothetical protein [Spirochaetales bacterium]